jgi:hypothetical protein
MPHVVALCVVVLAWTHATAEVQAQEAPATPRDGTGSEERLRGREHFEIGIQLVRERRWEDALQEFEASLRSRRSGAAMRNRALCLEQLGLHQAAIEGFQDYLDFAGDDLRGAERRAVEQRIEANRRRLVPLTLDVNMGGAELLVDGQRHDGDPNGVTLRLDPGVHSLELRRSGYQPLRRDVALATGSPHQLSLTLQPQPRRGTTISSTGQSKRRLHPWMFWTVLVMADALFATSVWMAVMEQRGDDRFIPVQIMGMTLGGGILGAVAIVLATRTRFQRDVSPPEEEAGLSSWPWLAFSPVPSR